MGNGKKINGSIRRQEPPQPPQPEEEQVDGPQDFVVVLAYTSDDGEVEEDFGRLVQDLKAIYTFKQNVRAYAVVDQAAKNVLSKVEKPSEEPSGRAVLVISYNQPSDTDAAYDKLSDIAGKVRELFKDEADVQVDVAIRETADEVLSAFPERVR